MTNVGLCWRTKMQTILIQILIKVGSSILIELLRKGADELERRKDNDFQQAGEVKSILSGVNVNGKTS